MTDKTSPNNNHRDQETWELTFNLFKLEYEQAAERYENIYRAIWQIFQYMALLSGGILTFASKDERFPIQFIIFIALIPLIFWFLATYIPMDKYGRDLGKRLSEIENQLNEKFTNYWSLNHYKPFDGREQKASVLWPPCKWWWRARFVIVSFGMILLIAFIVSLVCTIEYYSSNSTLKASLNKLELELSPLEVTLQNPESKELKNTLDILSKKIDSIDLVVQEIKADTDTMKQLTK